MKLSFSQDLILGISFKALNGGRRATGLSDVISTASVN